MHHKMHQDYHSYRPTKKYCKAWNPKYEMRYQQSIRQNTTTTKNQKKEIVWFNPPYSENVVTKVLKHFLSLSDKYFPPHNKFH